MIVTDMNDRERRAFAAKADTLAETAKQLAEALRKGDDTETLLYLALAGVTGMFITDLNDVFTKAVGTEIPNDPSPLAGVNTPLAPKNRKDN